MGLNDSQVIVRYIQGRQNANKSSIVSWYTRVAGTSNSKELRRESYMCLVYCGAKVRIIYQMCKKIVDLVNYRCFISQRFCVQILYMSEKYTTFAADTYF